MLAVIVCSVCCCLLLRQSLALIRVGTQPFLRQGLTDINIATAGNAGCGIAPQQH
jgi:hypothetical protein